MPEHLLYRCEPLLAWIDVHQCAANDAIAGKKRPISIGPRKRAPRNRLAVSACIGCPGVVVRATWPETPEPRWVGAEIEARPQRVSRAGWPPGSRHAPQVDA